MASQDRLSSSLEQANGIAIIGMAGRFPGADNLEKFWDLLEEGTDTHQRVPDTRFKIDSHYDSSGLAKNTTSTPYGCFLDFPDLFDRRLFNTSPREAEQMDPIHRLLLLTAHEALEMAGVVSNGGLGSESRNIGTFYGQASDDWRQVNSSQKIDALHIPGGLRSFGPGRINSHFGWEGPSMNVDTACSASAVAIQLACSSLRLRECNCALAGGANIMTDPALFAGLSRGHFLSPTGSCKTWDKDADGYCRAEAVGTLILKRFDDAVRDRDNILAVIRSAVTNHSADAVSITHPHSKTQEALYTRVLKAANVTPDEIDYVEMHGTGTIAGDIAESASVASIFGKTRMENRPLYIGSVKANAGHGEAASGVTSVIKALMMFRKDLIPKHVGIKSAMNKNLATYASRTILIPDRTIPFATSNEDGRRRVLINNFNANSGNTSILVEDYPQRRSDVDDPRPTQVVAVSASTSISFKGNIQRLIDHLKATPGLNISDLSYTTTSRRRHFAHRFACAVEHPIDLIQQLEEVNSSTSLAPPTYKLPGVAFLFTGQASSYRGMGLTLFQTSTVFRDNLCASEATCKELNLPPFLGLICDDDFEDSDPVCTQLAIVALEMALALLWKSWGIQPNVLIGHSLGEYAALCLAGIISVRDTLHLVGERAKLIAARCTAGSHTMMSVNMSSEKVQNIIDTEGNSCELACINGPENTSVGGPRIDIVALQELLHAKGRKAKLLETPYAFHSSQMDAIHHDFLDVVAKVQFSKPNIPFVSSLLGRNLSSPDFTCADYLLRHTRQPVNFLGAVHQSVELLSDKSDIIWVEIGPSPQCLLMVNTIVNVQAGKALASLEAGRNDWTILGDSLAKAYRAGLDILWSEYHRNFEHALTLLDLPTYAFDLQSHWLQYEGDWRLTKRDKGLDAALETKTILHSTTIHFVEKEEITEGSIRIDFITDLSNSDLRKLILGHKVNGLGLCPSSVYVDMAMTAADFLQKKLQKSEDNLATEVTNLKVLQPLIIRNTNIAQQLKIVATKSRQSECVEISVQSSVDSELVCHAQCTIRYGNTESWRAEWEPDTYLYQSRMQSLITSALQGKSHRLLRTIVYKLFSNLVQYEEPYWGMQEVILDDNIMEATASVRLASPQAAEKFFCSPYWIDSLCHLSGFVLNGSGVRPDDMISISHGFQSMRLARPLVAGRLYQTYVRMRSVEERNVLVGDVRIFDSGDMIGLFAGLKFREMKKDVLTHLLCSNSPSQSVTQIAARHQNPILEQDSASSTMKMLSSSQILDILAKELRIESHELTDDATLEGLGIDSILAISISTKLQECSQNNIPASLLSTCTTVGQLKVQLLAETQDPRDYALKTQDTPHLDPGPSIVSSEMVLGERCDDSLGLAEAFRYILATELMIDIRDIQARSEFSQLGLEPHQSLSIMRKFAKETKHELPPAFLTDNPTMADVQRFFEALGANTTGNKRSSHQGLRSGYNSTFSYLHRARSIASPILFLLPDGSGSASSYANLRCVPQECSIIAFDSPFQDEPQEYTISLEDMTRKFVSDILKLQATGPYLVGGWSIGGAYAYEAVVQLQAQDKQVKGLILIDSVCPRTLPSLPEDTIEVLGAVGVFNSIKKRGVDGKIPLQIHAHFARSIEALKNYSPTVLCKKPSEHLLCKIIWAGNGVLEGLPKEQKAAFSEAYGENIRRFNDMQKWLMISRKEAGSGGWEELAQCDTNSVTVNGDHFSIMRHPAANELSKALQTAMEDILVA